MRRVVIVAPGEVRLEEVPAPEPSAGQVVIRVAYCGICGSDLHAFQGKHPFIDLPATPGHEFSGRVEALGDGVESLELGQRVTVEPSLTCGKCYLCQTGRYNVCENLRVMGCQGEGAMADFFSVPAAKVVPIPPELSLRHAALVEPLAVGVHAARRAGDLAGKNVVIFGAGTIGLLLTQVVRLAGAKRIVVVDLLEERLKLASQFGATTVVNASNQDVVQSLLANRPYEGWDVAFEAVGVEATIRQALGVVRKGGRVVVVGVFGEEARVNVGNVQDRETEIFGTLMYVRRDFQDAIDLIAGGKVEVGQLVSQVFKLDGDDSVKAAFAAALDSKKNLKVLFEVGP
ncbi:MAG: alcohol dehydrogenase catalytic domain-containing protein [Promethearchaeota archaeon]